MCHLARRRIPASKGCKCIARWSPRLRAAPLPKSSAATVSPPVAEPSISGPDRVMANVFCEFREEWRQRCAVLKKKDLVTVVGKVVKIESYGINLTECELT